MWYMYLLGSTLLGPCPGNRLSSAWVIGKKDKGLLSSMLTASSSHLHVRRIAVLRTYVRTSYACTSNKLRIRAPEFDFDLGILR